MTSLLARLRSAARGGALLAVAAVFAAGPLRATPPELLRTPGYEAPVHIAPDDLLFIAGNGFQPGDRIVYEDARVRSSGHPTEAPENSSTKTGTAQTVRLDPQGRAIVAKFPGAAAADTVYRLWVVTRENEWSDSLLVNDPRPLWMSPDYVYASSDRPGLDRHLRLMGRNLRLTSKDPSTIRLEGPQVYELSTTSAAADDAAHVQEYIAEASLPRRMPAGTYQVSIRRAGEAWTELAGQTLQVRPDPMPAVQFQLTDPRFGGCRQGDADHSDCFARALAAAVASGGGTISIPAGNWNLAADSASGFEIPAGVALRGAGEESTSITWLPRKNPGSSNPLLTLTSRNVIEGISFKDSEHFASVQQIRPIIRLGTATSAENPVAVEDVTIANDRFVRVGQAVVDSGNPVRHLLIVHNEFGAYQDALYLAHAPAVADSILRWNHFLPGSYVDAGAHQGTIASEIGAGSRMDFSDNFADGAATDALQSPGDQRGFRAAFFWNLIGNQEQLMVAQNRIECPGDKAGDGEAISFDNNGNTQGFEAAAQTAESAGPDWVRVHKPLVDRQLGRVVGPDYYVGQWAVLMDGRGLGQTRRIKTVTADRGGASVTIRVSPAWDIQPGGDTRLVIEKQIWQTYIVGNDVRQDTPTCRKSNLNRPGGGQIGFWASSADSVFDGNHQVDSDGIGFNQSYSAQARSCPSCVSVAMFQTALEIRNNVIDGEYNWSSDCSRSGITGTMGASPTPESPPPRLSFGVMIDHNDISHADGIRGGAIDIALTWFAGPEQTDWPLVDTLLIFSNNIHDIDGPPPRAECRYGQKARSAMRFDGKANNTIMYGNKCDRARNSPLSLSSSTLSLCSQRAGSCECSAAPE